MTNREWLESLTDEELGKFLCDTAFKGIGCTGCRFGDACYSQNNGAKSWLNDEYGAMTDSEGDECGQAY